MISQYILKAGLREYKKAWNPNKKHWTFLYFITNFSLQTAFVWANTPEGWRFWSRVADAYHDEWNQELVKYYISDNRFIIL